ncbi:glycosyltransferase family 39 protein [Candidatus Pacearchaeota archaeon]|nr:glycosyltransferase family 39 protein [Candidatus Pacearchaeota archaeon]
MAFSFSEFNSLIKNKKFQIIFLGLVALIVRIYYLTITSGQTMWWDEAEYMSAAKHWALSVPYDINPQRPPLFQLLASFLLRIGFEEIALKFLLVVVPSIALVIAVYYLGKELHGHKIGIFSATATAFVWSLLFWSVRFQPDFLSVFFQLLACIFFWKLIKTENSKYAIYTGIFVAVGFYFKISALLIPLSFIIFAIYYDGWKLIKKKNYWIILGVFAICMGPFMIWQAINFGNPLAFAPSYSGSFNEGRSLGWMTLNFFYSFKNPQYSFPKLIMFILFLFGIGAALGRNLLSIDLAIKNKKLRKDPSVFSIIILLVVASFYIFYIKGTIEDRWVFLLIPFIFFFAASSISLIYKYFERHSKIIAVIVVCGIFIAFLVPQINHANALIKNKIDSYAPVKESSILIKQNSDPSDKILSVSYTQTTAYAEREVITYSDLPIENFTNILLNEKPKFVIASILEPHHPTWMVKQVQNEQGFYGIFFPYFNSTIVVSPQNQIVEFDIKKQVVHEDAVFTLIYPFGDGFGGLVAYRIDYT